MAVNALGAASPELPSSSRRQAPTFTVASLAWWSSPDRARDTPTGAVVLTLQGRVRVPSDGKRYPFDAQPELRNADYCGRSAWQLRMIEAL